MAFMDLFRPKWKSSDHYTRRHAVENGNYSAKTLTTIAFRAEGSFLQEVAVDRLADEASLMRIAETHRSDAIRLRAAARLTQPHGQLLLRKLAYASHDAEIQASAAFMIDDQVLLARIGTNSSNQKARLHAAIHTEDRKLGESIIVELAEHCPDGSVQLDAISRLTDQELLARIASTLRGTCNGWHAARMVTRVDLLRSVAVRVPGDWFEGERGKTLLAQLMSCRTYPSASSYGAGIVGCYYFEVGLCLFRLLGKKQEFEPEACSVPLIDYHKCMVWRILPICSLPECERCEPHIHGRFYPGSF